VCTRARVLCLHCYAVRVALPPFPTRRSSDLHVHAAMLRLACAVAGPDRVAMITDSISATGLSDGEYLLGPMRVRVVDGVARLVEDRKSTRLNSSHVKISYAVFCLKKKHTQMR